MMNEANGLLSQAVENLAQENEILRRQVAWRVDAIEGLRSEYFRLLAANAGLKLEASWWTEQDQEAG